jgi:hypothetical protein
MPKRKGKWTNKRLTIVGILIAIILGAPLTVIGVINYENSLPHPKLDVKIYSWYVNTTLNEDNTTYIGLNATFPAYITNTGNVPINIVLCDVYLSQNGTPSNISGEPISEIAYLKAGDIFAYNFTKYFNVSIPVNSTSAFGNIYNDYFLVVGYYTQNINDVTWVWTSPPSINFS